MSDRPTCVAKCSEETSPLCVTPCTQLSPFSDQVCERNCVKSILNGFCSEICTDPIQECAATFEHILANQLPIRDTATYIAKKYSNPILNLFQAKGIPTMSVN